MQLIELIQQVESGENLDEQTSAWLMGQIMTGSLDPQHVKQMILALKVKGESSSEVIGFVSAMLERTDRIDLGEFSLDIVGTGGDQSGSVNISSTAAIIAAAAGATVVKHGNRAASSKSGSADVLEALGITLSFTGKQVAACVAEVGIGFCFAPQFHPAMKNVAPIRKELGVPTIFNILGPLANPAQPKSMLVGVADPNRSELMAEVLSNRECVGFIASGDDGLDEITVTTTSTMLQFGTSQTKFSFDPTKFGIKLAEPELLAGGDAAMNAKYLVQTLTSDENSPKIQAIRAAAVLNAAAGLVAYWQKTNQHNELTFEQMMQLAVDTSFEVVQSGTALAKLTQWQQFCTSIK